jgi:hypothetical protein
MPVVVVIGVVVPLDNSPPALPPHPTVKRRMAVLPNNVIATLPLWFAI